MARERSSRQFSQSVIGDCGHVCWTWPQISSIGGSPEVICETCTRQRYAIPDNELLFIATRGEDKPLVWRRIADEQPAVKQPAAKKARRKAPEKQPSLLESIILEAFNGA